MNDDIPIGKLVPNNYNPRKRFDSAKMKELEGSIENQGIVQAITVRPLEKGKYEVVAGMRRFTAAKNVGLKKIPAMIRILDDEEARLLSITENLERADLTPIEEARSFSDYLGWDEQHHFEDGRQEGMLNQLVGLAEKVPMHHETIRKRLTLLHLPESLQIRVEQKTLKVKVAQAITRLKGLWEIRVKGLNDEKIDEQRNDIRNSIHELMEVIAKTVKTEEEARKRVNDYIEAEQMNLDQREKLTVKLQEELEKAKEKLIEFYEGIKEYPSNWDELPPDEKSDWVESYIQERIQKLSDEKLDEISKIRTILSRQHDRYLMNLTYVKDLVLSTCPHCGAAVKVDYLERKIGELQEELIALSEEEDLAGGELKEWRTKKREFEKISRDYNSKLNSYNASLKGVLDE